jgi:uncharacterized protein
MQEQTPFRKALRWILFPLSIIFMLPVFIYRKLISPIIPNSCIYTPTCSQYTLDALKRHGPFAGILLSLTRVARCTGGLFTGGHDPVPEHFSFRSISESYKKFRRKKRS